MTRIKVPMIIKPNEIDGVAALMTAEATPLSKKHGELDTEFVKRIVATYLNATGVLGVDAVRK